MGGAMMGLDESFGSCLNAENGPELEADGLLYFLIEASARIFTHWFQGRASSSEVRLGSDTVRLTKLKLERQSSSAIQ